MTARARYIMIGGFLGAGKTTALVRLGTHLAGMGRRVGLITNDQSVGLADTRIAQHAGLPVREITGGCFCCRFNSLMEAAEGLARDAAPDVFLAEPVGSCTDLKATVSYPLRRLYGERFVVAPFSVVLDPLRAARLLGLDPGRKFSPKVMYVYEKQMEEADFLVINKIDLLTPDRLDALWACLAERSPRARIFAISARDGRGLSEWFEAVLEGSDRGDANLPLDYDTYAEGEALLGWVNCTALVRGDAFDANAWLMEYVRLVQDRLRVGDVEIAHLKATISSPEADDELAVVQAAGTESAPEASYRFDAAIGEGELVVNLRAEGDPAQIHAIVRDVLAAETGRLRLTLDVVHEEHFRPARPVPTHRLVLTEP